MIVIAIIYISTISANILYMYSDTTECRVSRHLFKIAINYLPGRGVGSQGFCAIVSIPRMPIYFEHKLNYIQIDQQTK